MEDNKDLNLNDLESVSGGGTYKFNVGVLTPAERARLKALSDKYRNATLRGNEREESFAYKAYSEYVARMEKKYC